MERVTRALLLAAIALAPLLQTAPAVPPAHQADAQMAEVNRMLEQARREIRDFEQAGGKKADPTHPVGLWVEKLWAARERMRGTAAAGKATAEAIHLLVHAERVAEAEARTLKLATDDRAWESLGFILFEAAAEKKDYGFLIGRLQAVIPHQRDPSVRASLQYYLGRGHAKAGDVPAARAAYQAALREAPDSKAAKDAQTALYELENLGYGQAAPAFAAAARDGSRVALADLRGKVVLLVFWAST